MEKSQQSSLIGLNDEVIKSLQRIRETLIEGEVVSKYTFKEIEDIATKVGGEYVFKFFDKNNKYAGIYCDLAKAGIKEVKGRLLELLDGSDHCEEDDYLKEVLGALGLLFLGIENSDQYFKEAIKSKKLRKNDWNPYEIIPELIQIKNDKTELAINHLLKSYPDMPDRYLKMALSHLDRSF